MRDVHSEVMRIEVLTRRTSLVAVLFQVFCMRERHFKPIHGIDPQAAVGEPKLIDLLEEMRKNIGEEPIGDLRTKLRKGAFCRFFD